MIPGGRNFKEIERKKLGRNRKQSKTEENRSIAFCETHCEEEKPDFAPKVPFAVFRFPIYTGHLSCEKGFKNQSAILANCSSSSVSLVVQASGHLLQSTTSAKVLREMVRTRGAKSSSPLNRKRVAKDPIPDPLQSLRRQDQFLLGETRR
ncbi:hypothetical protein AAG906_027280 [Vitis piasezkii]